MDPVALNLKSGGGGGVTGIVSLWGAKRKGMMGMRPISFCSGFCGGRVLEIGVSTLKGRSFGYQHLEVRATGKKRDQGSSSSSGSNDPSIPEGDASEGSNSVSDDSKPDDILTDKSCHSNLDWRTFRANLVAHEKVQIEDSDVSSKDAVPRESNEGLSSKWAHPIPIPETGCILIATDKLDGVRNFERTVVLLLRIGTRDPREGPFGVIINRPLHKKIKHMKPVNSDLATTFADCSLQFGGPLEASMFLLRTGGENSPLPSFEQVVPGIYFGGRNSLDEAAGLVKNGAFRPRDFRFFVGYAGWQLDQLREEIESDYWIVAACSSDLIGSAAKDPSPGLWEEILQLMGGRYSDLSRKPKVDDP